MSYLEKVKEGKKAIWPYDKTLPNEYKYKDPEMDGYVFVGWKFNNQPPFYPNPNNESENPFGPINSDTVIQGILDIPNEIAIDINPSVSEISSNGRTIDVTYYLKTNHNYQINRGLNFEFVDTDQSWYEEGNVYFVDSTVRRTITILPNHTDEERVFTFKVSLGNLENEITLTQKARQESEECEPIVENTTGATTLALKMFGVDTEGSVFVGYTSNTYDIYYNCGSTLVGLLNKNNTGGLVKENSRISTIDEYAIMTKMPQYYGSIALTSPFTTTYTITTVNNSSKIVTLNYKGFIDENNLILLRGSIANKAIRVPCNGFNGKISIAQYPYDYSSDSLSNDPKMVYMSLIDGNFSIHGISQNTISYDGFDGELTNLPNSSIDYNFIYEIQPNDMCDYKLFVVYFTNIQTIEDGAINPLSTIYGTKQTDKSCVMLQFIQEYDVRNRIYYEPFNPNNTKSNYPSNFDDKYNETQSGNYKYHSWFETCSSKTLTENSFTLNLANGAYHIAYPVNDFDYTLSNLGTTVIDNYIWGDKSYTIIEVTNIQNITFTKNS